MKHLRYSALLLMALAITAGIVASTWPKPVESTEQRRVALGAAALREVGNNQTRSYSTLILEEWRPNLILTPVLPPVVKRKPPPVRSYSTDGHPRVKNETRGRVGSNNTSPQISSERDRIICEVFAGDCAWAVRKSRQECTTGSPSCHNPAGDYRGVMQMGPQERAKFGHGGTVREQAEAAKRYYDHQKAAGKNPRGPWGG